MDPDISVLISLIYEAVSDSSRWQKFLDSFLLAIGAQRGGLAIRASNRNDFHIFCWTGYSENDIRRYLECYAANDPWGEGPRVWPEGAVGRDSDIWPRELMEASAAYKEFYAPLNAVHGMGATILATPFGQSVITATRGAEQGPFANAELELLRNLLPHLRRAAILHGELGSLRTQLHTFTGHLDRYSHAFLLIDGERRILYANAASRDFQDAIVTESGLLSLHSPEQDSSFRKKLAAITSSRDSSVQVLEIPRKARKGTCRMVLMPAESFGSFPLGVSMPAATVLIVDSESHPEPEPSVLSDLFNLTPAEARVAGKLAQGHSVESIAAEIGVSMETVRSQVKRIFSKTATNRQGELIALILRSTPFRHS